METIKINSSDIPNLKYIDSGACGDVYRYNDDLAIKLFNPSNMYIINGEQFSGLIGVENDTCVFPKCRVEVDGLFKGYAMDYIEGYKLLKIAKEIDLNILIEAISKAENDIKLLSPTKIQFSDDNEGGLLWTVNGELKIIDTDFFEISDEPEEIICNRNLNHFNSLIELEIGFMNGPLQEYLNNNPEYAKLNSEYVTAYLRNTSVSIIELLRKAIEIFEKDFGVTPKSIKDMEEILKSHNLFDLSSYSSEDISLDEIMTRIVKDDVLSTDVPKPPVVK